MKACIILHSFCLIVFGYTTFCLSIYQLMDKVTFKNVNHTTPLPSTKSSSDNNRIITPARLVKGCPCHLSDLNYYKSLPWFLTHQSYWSFIFHSLKTPSLYLPQGLCTYFSDQSTLPSDGSSFPIPRVFSCERPFHVLYPEHSLTFSSPHFHFLFSLITSCHYLVHSFFCILSFSLLWNVSFKRAGAC